MKKAHRKGFKGCIHSTFARRMNDCTAEQPATQKSKDIASLPDRLIGSTGTKRPGSAGSLTKSDHWAMLQEVGRWSQVDCEIDAGELERWQFEREALSMTWAPEAFVLPRISCLISSRWEREVPRQACDWISLQANNLTYRIRPNVLHLKTRRFYQRSICLLWIM